LPFRGSPKHKLSACLHGGDPIKGMVENRQTGVRGLSAWKSWKQEHKRGRERPHSRVATRARVFERALHVRRSCDFSSRTHSAPHPRASPIFPASRKASALPKAWLSADRSAGDNLPALALEDARAAGVVLRIPANPTLFNWATNLDLSPSITTPIDAGRPT